MARQKCSQLDWNYDSEDEGDNSVQETVRIPHTKVNMGDLGTQSTRTSYLSTPASPAKLQLLEILSPPHLWIKVLCIRISQHAFKVNW